MAGGKLAIIALQHKLTESCVTKVWRHQGKHLNCNIKKHTQRTRSVCICY